MKKFAIILLSILIAGLFVACNQDITVDAQTYANMEVGTFVLNGQNYATLQAAVDAIGSKAAGDNDNVIYLTKDAAGPGAVINNKEAKIDFGEYKYSFTNVTAIQGQATGDFGLMIKGGSSVTLAGTKSMNLSDSTTGLTMVYVEGEGTSLAIESAPTMEVKADQFVFWAANGAILTIAGETKVSGGVAATGTTALIPTLKIEEGSKIVISTLKAENAAVVFNSNQAATVETITGNTTAQVVVTNGDVTITQKDDTAPTVLNAGSGTVTEAGEDATTTDSKALIGVTLYQEINDAISNVSTGQTITILKSIDSLTLAMIDKEFYVNLNGKDINNLNWSGITTGKMTILGEGVLTIVSDTPPAVGHLILRGGTYNCEVDPYADEGFDAVKHAESGKYKIRKMPAEVRYTIADETVTVSLNRFAKKVNSGVTFSGITVTQLADVDLTGIVWTPIGNGTRANLGTGNKFMGIFDGNNHTIKGLSNTGYTPEFKKDNEYVYGLFGIVNDAEIRNLTLTDITIFAPEEESQEGDSVAALIGFSGGALTVDNITIDSVPDNSSIKGYNAVAGVVGRSYGKNEGDVISITNCTNYAAIEGYQHVAGVVGFLNPSSNNNKNDMVATVSGCKNFGTVKSTNGPEMAGVVCFQYQSRPWTFNINNNENHGILTKPDTFTGAAAYVASASRTSDSLRDTYCSYDFTGNTNTGDGLPEGSFIVSGATLTGNAGNYVFEKPENNYEYNNRTSKEVLVGDNQYMSLHYFASKVNSGTAYSGQTIVLQKDVVLTEEWVPIGNGWRGHYSPTSNVFKGIFDGANHTISGLKATDSYNSSTTASEVADNGCFCYGLFGMVEGATIKDLKLADVSVDVHSNGDSVGAVVGYALHSVTITNCHVQNGTIEGKDAVGGIIGRAYGADGTEGRVFTITDCSNAANVTSSGTENGNGKAAGIGGYLSPNGGGADNGVLTVSNCTNTGSISSSQSRAAGIVVYGFKTDKKHSITISNNTNSGTVSVSINVICFNASPDNPAPGSTLTITGNISSQDTPQ